MMLGNMQEHVRQTWEHENSKIPKETMARQPMNTNVGAIHPGTSKCRAALMELWKESKQEAPPSRSADLMENHATIGEVGDTRKHDLGLRKKRSEWMGAASAKRQDG